MDVFPWLLPCEPFIQDISPFWLLETSSDSELLHFPPVFGCYPHLFPMAPVQADWQQLKQSLQRATASVKNMDALRWFCELEAMVQSKSLTPHGKLTTNQYNLPSGYLT
jgi:hypothetical protein